jgi:phosphoglycolate phosphatase
MSVSVLVNNMRNSETKMDQLKAVVFDFDGTLARLEIDFDLMRQRVREIGIDYGLTSKDFGGGYVLENMDAARNKLAHIDPAKADTFYRRAMDAVQQIEIDSARQGGLFPDVRPALIDLKSAQYQLAVITRNMGPAVLTVFPDLTEYCPVFLPRESVSRVKPDPEHLLSALRLLSVRPEEALMVGDHPIDILTGKSAGTLTCGVATGRISLEELADAGANLTFECMEHLADHLLGRSNLSAVTTS